MMQCLTDIIGITTSDCTCITAGLTDEQKLAIKVSNSGLYLDNLEGGVHMKAIKYADACKPFMELAQSSIVGAIRRLEDDLVVALNAKYTKSKKGYVGDIGSMSFAATLGNTKQYQGFKIKPYDYSDGLVTVTRLQIAVNLTKDFTVRILRVPVGSVMGDEVQTIDVSAQANTWFTHIFTTPLRLPLVYDGQMVEYWFVYDTTEDGAQFMPKDNKIECSSCPSNSSKVGDFVSVAGVSFDSLTSLNNALTDQYAHGFSVSVSIKCDNETLFCREYKEDDAVAVTMSWAALYKAGELLIEDVLKSPDVNRYTTMQREYLWGKRNHFRKEYETRITYLASVINIDDSNCYVCRQVENQPFVGGIFK